MSLGLQRRRADVSGEAGVIGDNGWLRPRPSQSSGGALLPVEFQGSRVAGTPDASTAGTVSRRIGRKGTNVKLT